MTKVLCIHHSPCQDGFTAAWCVRHALGEENVEFHPGVHGEPPPDVTGRDVVIVDFSYKRPVLEKMAETAKSILILDHHVSAQKDLAGIPAPPVSHPDDPTLRGWLPDAGMFALFDMDRSGAGIAWDYFHAESRPWFVNHVEDRDLWRFKLEGTREVAAYLFSHEYDFKSWDEVSHAGSDEEVVDIMLAGAAIERKHHKDIAELVGRNKREFVIEGDRVWALNVPYTLVSDAGHALCKLDPARPFACCYFDSGDWREFSLRSLADGADVSEIAKRYGGGGHAHAAGFRVPIENLWDDGSPGDPR